MVRLSKLFSDGRRQVGGFYVRGDLFGLEMGERHNFSAEAIKSAQVRVIERSAVLGLARRNSDIAAQLWMLTAQELLRTQDHTLMLVKTARERMCSFLLESAERERAGNSIEVAMPRRDIADYLGLTIETVSRTLSELETAGAIERLGAERIVLRDRIFMMQS